MNEISRTKKPGSTLEATMENQFEAILDG
jgi:hypothetical protein